MSDAFTVLDEAIESVTKLRRTITSQNTRQVWSADERLLAKAAGFAWFRTYRPELRRYNSDILTEIDTAYRDLTEFAEKATTRNRYKVRLSDLRSLLVKLRSAALTHAPNDTTAQTASAPDFQRLVSDPQMQLILNRRWQEVTTCLDAGAHLAAIVMMGALLEALLLARTNRLSDKSKLFLAKAAPKDKAGKALPQREWTLANYIDVSHELGWLRQSARDVGVVLRDYRNYIHPAKELAHGVQIEQADSDMFWVLFQNLARQIVASA
jgi:hypothetical protein